jgi:hypothetical protein
MDKEMWLQEQCQEIVKHAGDSRNRQVFKLMKKLTRKWQPTQSVIKDKNGKISQGKEETQQ